MFTEESTDKLANAIGNLKMGLLLSLAINVVLIVLVSTLFDGTEGFCDSASTNARESFRFVFLFQILVNAPTFVSFHLTDKYADGDDDSSAVRASFIAFLSAFLLKIYMTTSTFLHGPFEDRIFALLVALFVAISFTSYVLAARYSASTIISV